MRATLSSALFAASALLAACEHEPPPKKAPPAQPTPPPAGDPSQAAAQPPPPAPPAPPTPAVDAGVDALPPVSQECLSAAAHIADVLITEATDPQQKATLEQDKTKIVRRAAEACTRDSWKPEVLACFTKASTADQMQTCAKDLAAP